MRYVLKTTEGDTGKFIEYNPHTKKVTLEVDYRYLVEYDANKVYIEILSEE